jgi:hypothetical protein
LAAVGRRIELLDDFSSQHSFERTEYPHGDFSGGGSSSMQECSSPLGGFRVIRIKDKGREAERRRPSSRSARRPLGRYAIAAVRPRTA